ncbi:MAG: DUF4976 domain-containing protein, partial [Verrucomicrobiae bacterium]|nr:DUF4976 domain-containing protein [Verrucomicrobiae bacterium]
GEHYFWQKNNLHEDVTRVPMIISAPGYETGVSDAFVELVDMYPTMTQLAGVPVPDTVQGKSLVPILKNKKAAIRNEAFSLGNSGGYAIRSNDWTYIWYHDDVEELYDMKKDPEQFTNLAKDSKHAGILEEYRQRLEDRLQMAQLTRKPAKPGKGEE